MSQEFYQNNVKKIVILFKYLKKKSGENQNIQSHPLFKTDFKIKIIYNFWHKNSIFYCNV